VRSRIGLVLTSWIYTISPDYPDHLDFARSDRLWDTRMNPSVAAGDDIFFWRSGDTLAGWARATSDSFEISPDSPPAHWHDTETGGYKYRFHIEMVSEQPRSSIRWTALAAGAETRKLARNARIEIESPKGQKFLRSLFVTSTDITFPSISGVPFSFGDDLRERAEREIVVRRGQQRFRESLLDAYNHKCAVSDCGVEPVLEAAHIDRYFGDHSHQISNGLLLRSDLHALFDLRLIAFDRNYTVRVSPDLKSSEYNRFHGSSLRIPGASADSPNLQALSRHADSCQWFRSEW
jgi:putative restriction endonuclease